MTRLPSSALQVLAVAVALAAGLGELLALQSWRLRERLARGTR